MSGNTYNPPPHDLIDLRRQREGIIVLDGLDDGLHLTPEKAISLGLALMETGLYLKQKRKENEPK